MARRRWSEEEDFEIPQTPLIDIIFILIVFFLVATTFYSEERDLDVQLPEGTEGTAIAPSNERLVVNVRESGVIVVNNEVLDLEKLEARLAAIVGDDVPVEIRGDAEARHARIMEIMNLCRRVGLSQYALTQRLVQER